MNKKKCQIYAKFPITCFEVPIIGSTELNLTTEEIYKCLCSKAEVLEVLPNGQTINLDFANYDKENFIVESKPAVEEKPVLVELEEPEIEEDKKEIVEEKESVEEPTEEEKEEEVVEESPVKTHEVAARNEQFQKQNNYKKSKNKNFKR